MWISFVRHELNPSTARIPLTSFPVMTSTQFPLNQKQIGNTQLFLAIQIFPMALVCIPSEQRLGNLFFDVWQYKHYNESHPIAA